jgi:hypothetical protein
MNYVAEAIRENKVQLALGLIRSGSASQNVHTIDGFHDGLGETGHQRAWASAPHMSACDPKRTIRSRARRYCAEAEVAARTRGQRHSEASSV